MPHVISDDADVLGFLALLAGGNVELDVLTLVEALVAIALDVGEMDENVITLLTRDEAVTLFCIEEFHCACCHEYSFLECGEPTNLIRLAGYDCTRYP